MNAFDPNSLDADARKLYELNFEYGQAEGVLKAERLKELKNAMWLFKSTRDEADEMDAHLPHYLIASLWCTNDDDSVVCDKALLEKKIIKGVRDAEIKAIVEYYDSDSGGYVEINDKSKILRITDDGYTDNHNLVNLTIFRDDFKAWLISTSQWPLRAGCLLNYWYKDVSQFVLTQDTNDSVKVIKAETERDAVKKKHHSLMAWAECQRLFNSIFSAPIYHGVDWPKMLEISELAAMQTIDEPEKRNGWLLALIGSGNLKVKRLKVTRNVVYGEREKMLDFTEPSHFAEHLKSIGETPSRLVAAWLDAYGIALETQLEAVNNETEIKPRKKLKSQDRDRSEGLLLVYQLTSNFNVQYLDELPANKAWGKIISKEFTSDLIKSIAENNKSITLTGGEKLSKTDFCEKYRKRFQ